MIEAVHGKTSLSCARRCSRMPDCIAVFFLRVGVLDGQEDQANCEILGIGDAVQRQDVYVII